MLSAGSSILELGNSQPCCALRHDRTIRDVRFDGDTIVYSNVVPDNNASLYLHVLAQHNVVAQHSVRFDLGVVADLHPASDTNAGLDLHIVAQRDVVA